MESVTLRKPDDFHCHLRDLDALSRTVKDTAYQFRRAIIMPNLQSPVNSIEKLLNYRQRIIRHIPRTLCFTPLMTFYLTEDLTPSTLIQAKRRHLISACKYYPKGATTHSSAGVDSLKKLTFILETMQDLDIPLCLHGESIAKGVDIFEREISFIDNELDWLITHYKGLRLILEHISTQYAVEFIMNAPDSVAATITPHHLMVNRNDLLQSGIKPDYYCLPIVKTAKDQESLIEAAISGHSKFFLGTDSAPHSQQDKYSPCGCAGIYQAFCAMELYASVFEQYQALDKLEDFSSRFGAEFYRMPLNTETITIKKESWKVPQTLSFGQDMLTPFGAGKTLSWKVAH